ncbi:hypothetical protein SteCoe_30412 [Stentor coeruleus]|uniref:Uncharacterized protein n=1 Tax=Stentor coeruleus TaxID=5963 RepID=A0A1R2B3S9_9CILI|nr:hypothetical protein SteCoe_30412 [Stentor coeruleus]
MITLLLVLVLCIFIFKTILHMICSFYLSSCLKQSKLLEALLCRIKTLSQILHGINAAPEVRGFLEKTQKKPFIENLKLHILGHIYPLDYLSQVKSHEKYFKILVNEGNLLLQSQENIIKRILDSDLPSDSSENILKISKGLKTLYSEFNSKTISRETLQKLSEFLKTSNTTSKLQQNNFLDELISKGPAQVIEAQGELESNISYSEPSGSFSSIPITETMLELKSSLKKLNTKTIYKYQDNLGAMHVSESSKYS